MILLLIYYIFFVQSTVNQMYDVIEVQEVVDS